MAPSTTGIPSNSEKLEMLDIKPCKVPNVTEGASVTSSPTLLKPKGKDIILALVGRRPITKNIELHLSLDSRG
jgi:hypothetical protein